MKLGCCIMIQSVARLFLAKTKVVAAKTTKAFVTASAQALREKHACRHIQFWWRVVLDCRKEKHAALVIERFFLMVKGEVDREIERVARLKSTKRGPKLRKLKEDDEKWFERVWLNTVDDNEVEALVRSPTGSAMSSRVRTPSSYQRQMTVRSRSADIQEPNGERKNVSHRASSPTIGHVLRHEKGAGGHELRAGMLNLTYSPSPKNELPSPSPRKSRMHRTDLEDDLSLEEAFLDAAVQQGKNRRFSAEKYMKRFGIKTSQARSRDNHHFFADDLESTMSSILGSQYTPAASQPPKSSKSSASAAVHDAYKRIVTNPSTSQQAPKSTRSSTSLVVQQAYKNVMLKKARTADSPRRDSSQQQTYKSALLKHSRTVDSPRKSFSHRKTESPRHGKIRVMAPHPDFIGKRDKKKLETEFEEYDGEEFGLI